MHKARTAVASDSVVLASRKSRGLICRAPRWICPAQATKDIEKSLKKLHTANVQMIRSPAVSDTHYVTSCRKTSQLNRCTAI